MKISIIIKQLREQKDMTQKDLAEKVGVSNETISAWEKGSRFPSAHRREKLCEIFKINESELFGGVSKEKAHRIKVKGVVRAGGLVKNEHENKLYNDASKYVSSVDLSQCQGAVVFGDSMLPLAKNEDVVLYCKHNAFAGDHICQGCKGVIENGDLVYVKLKGNGTYFKKFYEITGEQYSSRSKEFSDHAKMHNDKKSKHSPSGNVIMLEPVNRTSGHLPIFCMKNEIESIHKVVSIFHR